VSSRLLDGMTRAALSNDERLEILSRQRGKCFYCWQKIFGWRFVLDHLVPRHLGGTDTQSNRVAAHPACDGRKGWRAPTAEELELQSALLMMSGQTKNPAPAARPGRGVDVEYQ
jgi:hypothetical protein